MLSLGYTLFLWSFVWTLCIINHFLTMHRRGEGVTNGWLPRKPVLVATVYGILLPPVSKVNFTWAEWNKIHCFKSCNTIVDDFIFVGVCLLFIDYTTNTIFCSGSLPFHINMQRFANSPCFTLMCELSLLNDGWRLAYREISLTRETFHTPLLRNHS